MSIESIRQALNDRVNDEQCIVDTIMAAERILNLREQFNVAFEHDRSCSYDVYMPAYRDAKTALHRVRKQMHRYECYGNRAADNSWHNMVSLEYSLETKIRELRLSLYKNPCKVCATCRSRNKAWPIDGVDVLARAREIFEKKYKPINKEVHSIVKIRCINKDTFQPKIMFKTVYTDCTASQAFSDCLDV